MACVVVALGGTTTTTTTTTTILGGQLSVFHAGFGRLCACFLPLHPLGAFDPKLRLEKTTLSLVCVRLLQAMSSISFLQIQMSAVTLHAHHAQQRPLAPVRVGTIISWSWSRARARPTAL